MIRPIFAPTCNSTSLSKYDYNAMLINRAKRHGNYSAGPLRTKFTYVKLKRPPSVLSSFVRKVVRPFFR